MAEAQETLGTRLRARRQGAGLTLAEVAERCGLSLQYVSNLERGRGNPTLDALRSLASALDTTVTALLGDREESFDPFEAVLAEAPPSLVTFARSELFTKQLVRLAASANIDPETLRRRLLVGMANSPRRSSSDPTEYDWLRLLDAYARILEPD